MELSKLMLPANAQLLGIGLLTQTDELVNLFRKYEHIIGIVQANEVWQV